MFLPFCGNLTRRETKEVDVPDPTITRLKSAKIGPLQQPRQILDHELDTEVTGRL